MLRLLFLLIAIVVLIPLSLDSRLPVRFVVTIMITVVFVIISFFCYIWVSPGFNRNGKWKGKNNIQTVMKSIIVGAIIGFCIMIYDFDFFINFGGPEANITYAIEKFIGIEYRLDFYPILVLPLTGGFAGLVAWFLICIVPELFHQNKK